MGGEKKGRGRGWKKGREGREEGPWHMPHLSPLSLHLAPPGWYNLSSTQALLIL